MNFDGEYRFIASVPPDELHAMVADIPDEQWKAFSGRQQVYAAHRATETIPLIYDADMRHGNPTICPAYDRFAPLLAAPMDAIATYFARHAPPGESGPGYFVRIILVRLLAGQSIGSHRDHGDSLARAHRVHFPIVTHPDVQFGIAGNVRHLEAGSLWEINNRKVHGVRNPSPLHRVHLIMDYVIPGEIVQDINGVITS